MCGISGIVSTIWSAASKIEKMLEIQSHRGPDAAGFFISPDGQCALAHNRLSIIDLADHAKQPMIDASGRYHIVFNGEIYNYLELKAELGDYPFRTNSDTEVILAAWHKWGERAVDRFIGMFAIAIWDDADKKLTAFRDRMGIKPFHYYTDKNSFVFGSEVKAVLAAGIPAEANLDVWGEYLNRGLYDHTDDTFFKNIKVLEPGHMLTFSKGQTSIKPYWKLSDFVGRQQPTDMSSAIDTYLEILFDAVKLRLRSDVPVGVNLSGGLDSSSLMSVVDQVATGGHLKSFTVSFKDTAYDEEDFASQVPTTKTWDRSYIRMGAEDIWSGIDKLMYHQEAPFGGIGTLSYYKLFEAIHHNPATVILEGQGVDECLAGYKYYQNLDARGANTYQDGTSFLKPDCIAASMRERGVALQQEQSLGGTALNHALYEDMRFNKLPRVLRMNDRLSMAFGKELREPFLDHRLVEFCFSLPDDLKIHNGQGKYLLRHAMKKYLPDSILSANKRAVVTPQREWIKNLFRTHIDNMLNSKEFADIGLFDVVASKAAFAEYCAGEGDNAFFIWQWLNAMSWAKTFKVNF